MKMTINELIARLTTGIAVNPVNTDTIKIGDADKELHRVAVSMFATVNIIRQVRDWGADFLIVHEPTFYNHMDNFFNSRVTAVKRALLEEAGLTVYRFHDYMHSDFPDQITKGELAALELNGSIEKTPYFASYRFTSDTPITALELAKRAENNLGLHHVRISGTRNHSSTRIAACFGTPAGVFELLQDPWTEILITGEISETVIGEYVCDASQIGLSKSVIVLTHIGSERDGMKMLTRRLSEEYPEFETRYFECGEVYTYTDSAETEE